MYLFLAVDCLSELNNPANTVIHEPLLRRLKEEVIEPEIELSWEASDALLDRIARNYPETLQWLKQLTDELSFRYYNLSYSVPAGAVAVVAKHYRNAPDTFPWLKTRIDNLISWVPEAAFFAIAEHYCSDPNTLTWLKAHAQDSEEIISVSYRAIAKYYRDSPETLLWLRTHLDPEQYEEVQCSVLEAIEEFYHDDSETFSTIKEQFHKVQPHERADASVKYGVVKVIAEKFPTHPETFEFMCEVAQHEIPILFPYEALGGYRGMIFMRAVETLLTHYPTYLNVLDLLRDRALNDPDEQLREWAQEQLKIQNVKLPIEEET